MRHRVTMRAARDAALAGVVAVAAVAVGSHGFRDVDEALLGYLAALLVACVGTAWRVSAFWRRPASAVYGRALRAALRDPRSLRGALLSGARDLAAQRFIARRSRARWIAHLLLSLGTLGSVAITVPLVCGWMRFRVDDAGRYQPLVAGIPMPALPIDGVPAWLSFHGLVLCGVAVTMGATWFLVHRLRLRTHADAHHVAPLVLLLVVALSGLALPASRTMPRLFDVASMVHELAVVVMLVALPFSKLAHVLVRPLQIGARLVRAPDVRRAACLACGAPLAPVAQLAAVERLLVARGARFQTHPQHCQPCRRRLVARAEARLVDAGFQPPLTAAARADAPGKAA